MLLPAHAMCESRFVNRRGALFSSRGRLCLCAGTSALYVTFVPPGRQSLLRVFLASTVAPPDSLMRPLLAMRGTTVLKRGRAIPGPMVNLEEAYAGPGTTARRALFCPSPAPRAHLLPSRATSSCLIALIARRATIVHFRI